MSGQERELAPELAARLTAAGAVLGDFQREGLDALAPGPEPDWASWAHRLGAELRGLLDVLGHAADADAGTGRLDAIRGLGGYGPTLREALRDAIRYQQEVQPDRRRVRGPGRLYRVAAETFGLNLGSLADDAAGAPQHVCLDAAQLDTVLDALDEAVAARHVSAGRECADCDMSPAGLCDGHSGDLERAGRYDATARQLRQEAGR